MNNPLSAKDTGGGVQDVVPGPILQKKVSEVKTGNATMQVYIKFQSLLFWKWFRKLTTPALTVYLLSFNPCCSGSGSGRLRNYIMLLIHFKFQSLLFWKWFRKIDI